MQRVHKSCHNGCVQCWRHRVELSRGTFLPGESPQWPHNTWFAPQHGLTTSGGMFTELGAAMECRHGCATPVQGGHQGGVKCQLKPCRRGTIHRPPPPSIESLCCVAFLSRVSHQHLQWRLSLGLLGRSVLVRCRVQPFCGPASPRARYPEVVTDVEQTARPLRHER